MMKNELRRFGNRWTEKRTLVNIELLSQLKSILFLPDSGFEELPSISSQIINSPNATKGDLDVTRLLQSSRASQYKQVRPGQRGTKLCLDVFQFSLNLVQVPVHLPVFGREMSRTLFIRMTVLSYV